MFKTMQSKYPGWFNILRAGNSKESSVKLTSVRWKYANTNTEDEIDAEIPEDIIDDEGAHEHDEAFRQENQPSPHLYMPMPEVRNLDLVLPLTSTPWEAYDGQGSGQIRSRLSDVRPRGLLPMEFEDSPLARPGPSRIRDALAKRARGVRKAIFNESDSSDD